MGLFDKKFCDVCGGKIGLLGNRKLDDGNLCKDCANKLSPWFTGRRRSTVEDIKAQLAYREQNAGLLDGFRETRVFGRGWKIHIDDNQGLLFVSRARDWREENPDVLRFDQVTGCSIDIDETRHEEAAPAGGPGGPQPGRPGMGGPQPGRPGMGGPQPGRPGMGGPQPGRPGMGGPGGPAAAGRVYYTYDFDVILHVNADWFDEIRFRLNPSSVRDRHSAEYGNYAGEAEQIRSALLGLTQANVQNIAAANAPKQAVACPFCGASTIPDANGCCEFCGGAVGG